MNTDTQGLQKDLEVIEIVKKKEDTYGKALVKSVSVVRIIRGKEIATS